MTTELVLLLLFRLTHTMANNVVRGHRTAVGQVLITLEWDWSGMIPREHHVGDVRTELPRLSPATIKC